MVRVGRLGVRLKGMCDYYNLAKELGQKSTFLKTERFPYKFLEFYKILE